MALGELDVICNVGLLGEGYDLAAQAGMDVTIECVGMARPTQSVAMYLQQVGRALRPKDEPAVILDHAGNIMAHGLPDDDRDWQLEPREKKGKKKAGAEAAPIKVCPNCFATAAANKSVCPFCEEPYPVRGDRMPGETEDELVAVDPATLRAHRAQQEKDCKSIDDFIRVAKARGYAKPAEWAAHRWTAREKYGNRRVEEQAAAQKRW